MAIVTSFLLSLYSWCHILDAGDLLISEVGFVRSARSKRNEDCQDSEELCLPHLSFFIWLVPVEHKNSRAAPTPESPNVGF